MIIQKNKLVDIFVAAYHLSELLAIIKGTNVFASDISGLGLLCLLHYYKLLYWVTYVGLP